MAQLKKTVTERRQQKQSLDSREKLELVEEGVAGGDESAASLTGYASLNASNNNSLGMSTAHSGGGVGREMGRRAVSSELPRPEAPPPDGTAKSGSMSDIFVSKSSLHRYPGGGVPGLSVNLPKPTNQLKQQRKSGEEQVTSEPYNDDVI